MAFPWRIILVWLQAILLAAVPWLVARFPVAAPIAVAVAVLVERPWRILGPQSWGRAILVSVSAIVFLAWSGGWRVLGAWLALGFIVGLVAAWSGRQSQPRPDPADALLLLGWGGALAVFPPALGVSGGGWAAPLLLLLGARRMAGLAGRPRPERAALPGPPDTEVRGDLIFEGVVLGGPDGLPCSAPLDFVLEPGESLAILSDDRADCEALALTAAGKRRPAKGQVLVDGRPISDGNRVVAVVGPGELFVMGSMDDNLAALSDAPLTPGERLAVEESCSLGEVRVQMEGQALGADGAPLSTFHRLLLLAARVIPSHYRVVVVLDPMPWVDSVRGEAWRAAVVRASVGRTALWVTSDRDLASRADRLLIWRHGAVRGEREREVE